MKWPKVSELQIGQISNKRKAPVSLLTPMIEANEQRDDVKSKKLRKTNCWKLLKLYLNTASLSGLHETQRKTPLEDPNLDCFGLFFLSQHAACVPAFGGFLSQPQTIEQTVYISVFVIGLNMFLNIIKRILQVLSFYSLKMYTLLACTFNLFHVFSAVLVKCCVSFHP